MGIKYIWVQDKTVEEIQDNIKYINHITVEEILRVRLHLRFTRMAFACSYEIILIIDYMKTTWINRLLEIQILDSVTEGYIL
jgi:hypothetical protein